jgi:predicted nucleotidyltransferase
VSKTVGIEGSIKKEISSIKSINYAFIYGSFAADREKATSDIDLMIIGDPDVIKLSDVINKLETKLQRTINPTVYSLLEYRERKGAKQGFINNLLNNPKIMLIGEEDDL